MTQHYGIRQLAFRKSLSFTLAFAGLNLFVSSWPSMSPLDSLPIVFISIFSLSYFGSMLKYHTKHAINWSLVGICISLLASAIVIYLGRIHSDLVAGTAFDELRIVEQLSVPYAETKYALVMFSAVGASLSIAFGMLGLSFGLFKSTAGVFLGIGMGFTPGFTYVIQHLSHGHSIFDALAGGVHYSMISITWIACLCSAAAMILAGLDRAHKGYVKTMAYENEDSDWPVYTQVFFYCCCRNIDLLL